MEKRNQIELTPNTLAVFVGGQMEIQNEVEEYLYRGEIKTVAVENGELRVRFVWLAKGEGFPPIPNRWVSVDKPDYVASLENYGVSDIGGGRICLSSSITNETVVLFPKGGSRLDPAKVEGLELQPAGA